MKKPRIKNAFPELFLAINTWTYDNLRQFSPKDRERICDTLAGMWKRMTGKEIDFINKRGSKCD